MVPFVVVVFPYGLQVKEENHPLDKAQTTLILHLQNKGFTCINMLPAVRAGYTAHMASKKAHLDYNPKAPDGYLVGEMHGTGLYYKDAARFLAGKLKPILEGP